jgi:hypothetical protein
MGGHDQQWTEEYWLTWYESIVFTTLASTRQEPVDSRRMAMVSYCTLRNTYVRNNDEDLLTYDERAIRISVSIKIDNGAVTYFWT